MRTRIISKAPFEHLGHKFELVVFVAEDELEKTYFRVHKDGELFPLKVLGGQLSFVTFELSQETKQYADTQGHFDLTAELLAEAKRMIGATLNG